MRDFIILLFQATSFFVIFYMGITAVSYIVLFLFSLKNVMREGKLIKSESLEDIAINERTYPVSIIVPAFNEEVGVVSTVRSLLTLQYPQYEIIIVDDGSKDDTLNKLIEELKLEKIDLAVRKHMNTQTIKATYKSNISSLITVVSKENGGKADALNCGINVSKYPYFCAIDGDSILEQDALLKVMKPIIDTEGKVIAVGGSVRIANGTTISRSKVEAINLPKNPLVIMQIVEYFRAFLIGRLGFTKINQLLIISGAFGLFHKNTVIKSGGYKVDTVGEDMELIVRLHRMIKDEKLDLQLKYIPDPVCWTEAPSSIKVLKSQRVRWQIGLAETLNAHKKMFFNPKYGLIGFIGFPYFVTVELLGAVIEILGFFLIVGGLLFGFLDPFVIGVILTITILYGSFISSLSILLEELTMFKYPKVKHLVLLFLWALTESFWFRPLLVLWRLEGLLKSFRRQKSEWGKMERKGISSDSH
ncbi:glycosyltransferase [Psychrobacillus sp. FSL H8-0483]|uniref:glycosyltransferase family 2 protein n=1 Tax=Psychrobacillus sp. FSL H8-0483 TaxID=2921389 RepID=UPI00315AED52